VDPTVRKREKGREGECNYQLAKCIHIPSQKDRDVGWKGREREQGRVKEVEKWRERYGEGGGGGEGPLDQMEGRPATGLKTASYGLAP